MFGHLYSICPFMAWPDNLLSSSTSCQMVDKMWLYKNPLVPNPISTSSLCWLCVFELPTQGVIVIPLLAFSRRTSADYETRWGSWIVWHKMSTHSYLYCSNNYPSLPANGLSRMYQLTVSLPSLHETLHVWLWVTPLAKRGTWDIPCQQSSLADEEGGEMNNVRNVRWCGYILYGRCTVLYKYGKSLVS